MFGNNPIYSGVWTISPLLASQKVSRGSQHRYLNAIWTQFRRVIFLLKVRSKQQNFFTFFYSFRALSNLGRDIQNFSNAKLVRIDFCVFCSSLRRECVPVVPCMTAAFLEMFLQFPVVRNSGRNSERSELYCVFGLATRYFVIEESFCQSPFSNFRTVQRNINKEEVGPSKLFLSILVV